LFVPGIVSPIGKKRGLSPSLWETNYFLAFDRALGQTAYDLILQEEIDEHDWQGANQGASRKHAPLFVKLTRSEDLQTDHQRILRTVV